MDLVAYPNSRRKKTESGKLEYRRVGESKYADCKRFAKDFGVFLPEL